VHGLLFGLQALNVLVCSNEQGAVTLLTLGTFPMAHLPPPGPDVAHADTAAPQPQHELDMQEQSVETLDYSTTSQTVQVRALVVVVVFVGITQDQPRRLPPVKQIKQNTWCGLSNTLTNHIATLRCTYWLSGLQEVHTVSARSQMHAFVLQE
jgi:hypothetical protein